MGMTLLERAVLGAAALGFAVTLGAQTSSSTVRDGVFSAEQAERGARVFESVCTNCHEMAEFIGAGAYLDEVEGQPLWETFDYVSTEMPEDDPASLRPEEYAAVLAYILSVYGLPSGDAELGVEQQPLEAITIVRPALPGS
ncbi:MAG TPA: c-type cytochrome [Gammaproteobacteria bacterium]|nr:c-type cytochrome [Gammaproteobacteria bacterium]